MTKPLRVSGVLRPVEMARSLDSSNSPPRRALLVGINRYEPFVEADSALVEGRSWTNLLGAVNDTLVMEQTLRGRFGFRSEEIRVLTDQQATRDSILGAIEEHLVAPSAQGAELVFCYAGHGSRVPGFESGSWDETLVPADSALGAPDIRDKELRHRFNRALDREARLTAIFDSCHSGGVMRGPSGWPLPRFLKEDPSQVSMTQFDPGPPLEERGALILSAAQGDELAWEAYDEERNLHGAFSLSLLRALEAGGGEESALRTFLRARALLRAQRSGQEPVLAGGEDRVSAPLFGPRADQREKRTVVAVGGVGSSGRVVLEGGRANGLAVGSRLASAARADARSATLWRVGELEGWSRAWADPVDQAELEKTPDAALQAGDLLELQGFAASGSTLRLWIPESLAEPRAERLAAALFKEGGVLERAAAAGQALYHLEALPTESWRREKEEELAWVCAQPNSGSSLATTLPFRTDGFTHAEVESEIAALLDDDLGTSPREGLVASARTLARIHGWLTLQPPPGDTFPYRLALRRLGGDSVTLRNPPAAEALGTDSGRPEVVTAGERYGLSLIMEGDPAPHSFGRRWVYVFLLDSQGRSQLLFPPPAFGNVESRLPSRLSGSADQGEAQREIDLGSHSVIRIGPPFGVDTYLLLTSGEPIGTPTVLEFDGVRRRGQPEGVLGQLLASTTDGQRGAAVEVPRGWSLERLVVRSQSAGTIDPACD